MRFEDVTEAAGLVDSGGGFSAAAADHDGDGDVDLFVFNRRAESCSSATEATAPSKRSQRGGIAGDACSVDGTLLDVDGDGRLDLYVGNYLTFDPGYRLHYAPDVFPGPLAFAAEDDILYRNVATARSRTSRRDRPRSRSRPRHGRRGLRLRRRRAAGRIRRQRRLRQLPATISEGGASRRSPRPSGVAFGFHGEATGAMAGVVGDFDLDGLPDLHVTDTRYGSLYRNQGKGPLPRPRIRGGRRGDLGASGSRGAAASSTSTTTATSICCSPTATCTTRRGARTCCSANSGDGTLRGRLGARRRLLPPRAARSRRLPRRLRRRRRHGRPAHRHRRRRPSCCAIVALTSTTGSRSRCRAAAARLPRSARA